MSFCISAGAEALFADLGHFSMKSIQVDLCILAPVFLSFKLLTLHAYTISMNMSTGTPTSFTLLHVCLSAKHNTHSMTGLLTSPTGPYLHVEPCVNWDLCDMQLSTLGLVWPTLMLTYLGQASYIIKHPEMVSTAYYSSVPQAVFWPMFVLAVMSAIIASQVHHILL